MKKIEEHFELRLKRGNDKLFFRIKELNLDVRVLLLNWVMTLFTRVMDLDLVGRLWDIIFLNEISEQIILEVCFQLLEINSKKILDEDLDG